MAQYKKMTREFAFAIISMIALIILATPLAAQDDAPPCTPDLTSVHELLDQADALVTTGASEDALARMSAARDQLQILINACAPQPVINLAETLVIRSGQLRLNYPENWVHEILDDSTDEGDPTQVQFGNSSAVIENANNAPVPTLNPGEQLVFLIAGLPDAVVDDLDTTPSAVSVLKAIQQTIKKSDDDVVYQFGDIDQTSINDHQAATLEFHHTTFAARLYVVELERQKMYAVVMAVSAPGELEALAPTALEMAASVRYDPAGTLTE